jgi:hypothetical protein
MDVASTLPRTERGFLLQLQRQALHYFLENQTASGFVLDRQRNHGSCRAHGFCSTAASGMGFLAVALASAEPYHLLTRIEAVSRVTAGLTAALRYTPHTEGVLPHFIDAATGAVAGADACSTIDTAWLLAGALWAAEFLQDAGVSDSAAQLFNRVHWGYWTAPDNEAYRGLIRHGHDARGRFLRWAWDRLNGETVFLYVLAAGAENGRAWAADAWPQLGIIPGFVAGLRFGSADLGLFVFQYGLDLLDLDAWREPDGADLAEDARRAALANHRFCQVAASRFTTYRNYWGLSAGDGPGASAEHDVYRPYSPAERLDGTAHLTASLASIGRQPALVLDNLNCARRDQQFTILGRYGFSCVNVDRGWVGRDMVGIDAGAAVLALDNYLCENRVRRVFHRIPAVQRGLARIGFVEQRPTLRLAS